MDVLLLVGVFALGVIVGLTAGYSAGHRIDRDTREELAYYRRKAGRS
jgi:membrane protein DedA with SNARE-associated domain